MTRSMRSCRALAAGLSVAALPLLLAACDPAPGGAAAAEPGKVLAGAVPPPVEMVVVLDRSGSLTRAERAVQETLLAEITGDLSYGDRLVVQVAHASGVSHGAPPVVVDMPPARNPVRPLQKEKVALETARRVNGAAIARVFEGAEVPATDLIASLHTARNRFSGGAGRARSLVILSDMLQCAGGLCFEPGRDAVPGAPWIAQRAAAGTVPDLAGICVAVAGADPSTAHGVRVREFWAAYFAAAGAELAAERYRHEVASAAQLRCA